MPACPSCQKEWPAQYWVCPEDGTVLNALRSAVGSLHARMAIPREDDLRPGTLIGEYRVEGKLGQGGMASVFAAIHPVIGKKVAIKVISRRLCADLHAVERFIGEARTVNQIGHPNLVDIFAFGVLPDGRAYLVMEWLQGETLAARLSRGRLPTARAFEVLLQIVEALEAAHEHGVVHRDLKPENIFVREQASGHQPSEAGEAVRVKLLDFGIAKLADSDASVPKTRSGVAMGTAGYMSPEQARGRDVDHRTDLYALGCVAYEVLLGRLPFVADTAIDLLAMHLAATPPAPKTLWRECPPAVDWVLLQLLAKEPDARPSLAEVRLTFADAARSPPAPTDSHSRSWQRWSLGLGGGLMLFAALWAGHQLGSSPRVRRRAGVTRAAAPHARATTLRTQAVPTKTASVGKLRAALWVHAPRGAKVEVDGQRWVAGAGPLRLSVAEGEHRIVVTAPHRVPFRERVRIGPGTTAEVRARLPRTPSSRKKRGAHAVTRHVSASSKLDRDYILDPFH